MHFWQEALIDNEGSGDNRDPSTPTVPRLPLFRYNGGGVLLWQKLSSGGGRRLAVGGWQPGRLDNYFGSIASSHLSRFAGAPEFWLLP